MRQVAAGNGPGTSFLPMDMLTGCHKSVTLLHRTSLRNGNQMIGEFGSAPAGSPESEFVVAGPMYWLYEMGHAALNPARAVADATRLLYKNPVNPLSHTTFGKTVAAACELFERSTRRYGKPEWDISHVTVGGERVPIEIDAVWERPFCRLLHFRRFLSHPPRRPQPRV